MYEDQHAERRDRKRQKLSRGGKPMIVVGRGYVRACLQAISAGAEQPEAGGKRPGFRK